MGFRRAAISRKATLPEDHAGIEFSCTHFERGFGNFVNRTWIDTGSIYFFFSINKHKTYPEV